MRKTMLIAALAASPMPGMAQDQLDRLEAVSEVMNAALVEMMAAEMAANGADPAPLRATMPDMAWDDEMRAAGSCMLGRYEEILGSDGVEEMIVVTEEMSETATEIVAAGGRMEDMPTAAAVLPEGLTPAASTRIMQECGMQDLQLKRMEESGFMAAMMNAAQ